MQEDSTSTLSYATPGVRAARVAPAVWLAVIGLALIGLGGCFLVGVMGVLTLHGSGVGAPPIPPGQVLFLVVLYAAALGCFGGAVIMLVRGVKALFKFLTV